MSLSSLPEDIQGEIFLKLPVNSILACKCVCKLWFTLLSNTKFVNNHLHLTIQNTNNIRIILSNNGLRGTKPFMSSMDYAAISPLSCERDGDVHIDYPMYPFQDADVKAIRILGSCNGLICLGISTGDCDFNKICIWNPSTKEYKQIPDCHIPCSDDDWLCNILSSDDDRFAVRYGFGFDDNMDDYKVVRVPYDDLRECSNIQVYTLGSDSWHEVQTVPHWLHSLGVSSALLFNGALHWLGFSRQGTSSDCIVSFKLSHERLMQLPFPGEIRKNREVYEKEFKIVGVLGDCICLNISRTDNNDDISYTEYNVDIWIMQDYGVQESWIKRFTITQLTVEYSYCKPIWSFGNGEILLDTLSDLITYDPKSGNVGMAMPVRCTDRKRNLEFYVESLVSVKSNTYVEKTIKN